MFGCVTITINTPLPAYQLLDHSNGLSPSIVSLWALFLLVYNYISSLVPRNNSAILIILHILSLFSFSFLFSSFLSYISTTLLPLLFCYCYTTTRAKHESDVRRGLHMYLLFIGWKSYSFVVGESRKTAKNGRFARTSGILNIFF
jgi:hypothetical protein